MKGIHTHHDWQRIWLIAMMDSVFDFRLRGSTDLLSPISLSLSLSVLLKQLKLFDKNPLIPSFWCVNLCNTSQVYFSLQKLLSPPLTMARAWNTTTTMTCCTYYYCIIILLMVLLSSWRSCDGLGTFGYGIHHRFSDPVKGILGVDELPEKGSADYYVAMAHRDRIIRGRHLASINDQSPLAFSGGNDTYLLNSLGLYDPYSTPQIIIQICVFSVCLYIYIYIYDIFWVFEKKKKKEFFNVFTV